MVAGFFRNILNQLAFAKKMNFKFICDGHLDFFGDHMDPDGCQKNQSFVGFSGLVCTGFENLKKLNI